MNVKYVLFKTFCMPLYGCQLWDFSSHHCNSFFTAWRKAIRRLLMISPRSHSNLLHLIVNDLPIEIQLHKRFIKFFYSILHSENPCTRICAHLALNNSNSLTGKSLNFICNLYRFDKKFFATRTVSKLFKHLMPNDAEPQIVKAVFISELINFRDSLDNPVDKNNLIEIINDQLTE
jgi:hypothetical protein